MFEAPAIIGTCINCIAPGSLSATLALVLIGAGVALTAERRKVVPVATARGASVDAFPAAAAAPQPGVENNAPVPIRRGGKRVSS